jgi:hypothetical protein
MERVPPMIEYRLKALACEDAAEAATDPALKLGQKPQSSGTRSQIEPRNYRTTIIRRSGKIASVWRLCH